MKNYIFTVLTEWKDYPDRHVENKDLKFEEKLTAFDIYRKFGYSLTISDLTKDLPFVIVDTEIKRTKIISYE